MLRDRSLFPYNRWDLPRSLPWRRDHENEDLEEEAGTLYALGGGRIPVLPRGRPDQSRFLPGGLLGQRRWLDLLHDHLVYGLLFLTFGIERVSLLVSFLAASARHFEAGLACPITLYNPAGART